MYNYFGNIVKNLRKQRNLTQEEMAEILNVSCQAVSKWETNASYPDISLFPILADYFGVSIDYLLGHDMSKREQEIKDVCDQADAMFATHQFLPAVPLLRNMLIKHPGNAQLMYKLAWALSGTRKASPENYEEAIHLYLRILEISTDSEMRTRVTRDLMYRYITNENEEKALYYANQLPSFDLCREYHLGRSNLLKGKELSQYLQANIERFGSAMLECLEYFVCENILTSEEKEPYTVESAREKIRQLKEILA